MRRYLGWWGGKGGVAGFQGSGRVQRGAEPNCIVDGRG